MRNFYYKLTITFLCFLGAFLKPFNNFYSDFSIDHFIFLVLISLSISFLLDITNQNINFILYFLYAFLCIYRVDFLYFMPLIAFNAHGEFGKYSFFCLIPFVFQLFYLPSGILTLITILLSKNELDYQVLLKDNRKTKDDYRAQLLQEV